MKVIDLLNKIANGEEVPKKIKYGGNTYYKDSDGNINFYIEKDGTFNLFLEVINDTNDLNNEVEILDEEEKDNFSGIRYFKDGECYLSISSEPLKTNDIEECEFINIEEINGYVERDKKLSHNKSMDGIVHNFNLLIDSVNHLVKNQKKIINKLKEEGKC